MFRRGHKTTTYEMTKFEENLWMIQHVLMLKPSDFMGVVSRSLTSACIIRTIALKMDAENTSKTSLNFYQATRLDLLQVSSSTLSAERTKIC